METALMTAHPVGTREEWLKARLDLLKAEKALTDAGDEVAPHAPNTFAAMCGVDGRTYLRELPGMSAFLLGDGEVYHTYSTYGRGLDILWGSYQWLDRAPLGRNEKEGIWWKRRDEYGAL